MTIAPRTLCWWLATIGTAILATLAFAQLTADAADGTGPASVFHPITPCRAIDTRPDTNIGPHQGPIGPDQTITIDTGDDPCDIPDGATAVTIVLTGIAQTADTYLSVGPAGTDPSGTSAVNLVADGQRALPDEVTVQVSDSGEIVVYNAKGHTHAAVDVMGFYTPAPNGDGDIPQEIYDRLDALEAENAALKELTASMSLDTVDGYTTVRFTGVNVQVVDGTGDTQGATNGLGNLVIGYHEDIEVDGDDVRTGSHNLVIGTEHSYTSYATLIAGYNNTTNGPYSSVTGGRNNTANGDATSVTGGYDNTANGDATAVAGGYDNTANGDATSVTGGYDNTANGFATSVTGGRNNTANNAATSVTGGRHNTANNDATSVTGGFANTANGDTTSVTGGRNNTADGEMASVTSGRHNTADGVQASVTGGQYNTAADLFSSVTGGSLNTADGRNSSVTGGSSNTSHALNSSVTGGRGNTSYALYSSVTGGQDNTAGNGLNDQFAEYSSITGGHDNTTTVDYQNLP